MFSSIKSFLSSLFTPSVSKDHRYNYFREQTTIFIAFIGLCAGIFSLIINRLFFANEPFFLYGELTVIWIVVNLIILFLLKKYGKTQLAANLFLLLTLISILYIITFAGTTDPTIIVGTIVLILLIGTLATTKRIVAYSFMSLIIISIALFLRQYSIDHSFNSIVQYTQVFSTLYIAGGVLIFFLQTLRRQIDEHIDAEEKTILETTSILNNVVKTSPLAIYLIQNGVVTLWNEEATNMFGWRKKEVIDQELPTIPKEKEEEYEEIKKQIYEKDKVSFETTRQRKNGKIFKVSLSASTVRDFENKVIGIIEIVEDITERKELEARKDDFITMASHELKTPITSLKMYCKVLNIKLDDEKSTKEDISYLAINIDKQLTKLMKLVEELLDISRIQSGKLNLNIETFNLENLISETVEAIDPLSEKHNLIIDQNDEAFIEADKERLSQVLSNLLINAIKYSDDPSDIIIRSIKKDNEVEISIQDFGMGIDKEYQEKIFERFYQVTDKKEKTYPGLGMGLFISSEIIKRHNGRIWVKSKRGNGSTFYINLPSDS